MKWWERAQERFARTHAGGWFAINVANPIDRRLLRWTRGRFGLFLGQPVGLLETVGARSGQPRSTPLLYREDDGRVVLIASKAGAARHPAWYHNVRAHPEVGFTARDRKSTRLNSSHVRISYAVFCLKKKKRTRRGSSAGESSCAA